MDAGIAKAQEKISFVSQDKEALRAYEMREMALSDYTSGMNHARREGEQRGIAIGEQRGERRGIAIGERRGEQRALTKYVFKLSQKGMSIKDIAELADLPVEEVNRFLKEM
jgi:predicted transposase/invertase (TIGR01784 family)